MCNICEDIYNLTEEDKEKLLEILKVHIPPSILDTIENGNFGIKNVKDNCLLYCAYAVLYDATSIEYIPEELQDPFIINTAILSDMSMLYYVGESSRNIFFDRLLSNTPAIPATPAFIRYLISGNTTTLGQYKHFKYSDHMLDQLKESDHEIKIPPIVTGEYSKQVPTDNFKTLMGINPEEFKISLIDPNYKGEE